MEQTTVATPVASSHEVKDAFAKLVLGTAAGFLAGKLAEKSYDAAMVRFRTYMANRNQ